MLCTACATNVAEHQKFCHECGASLRSAASTANTATEATHSTTENPAPPSAASFSDPTSDASLEPSTTPGSAAAATASQTSRPAAPVPATEPVPAIDQESAPEPEPALTMADVPTAEMERPQLGPDPELAIPDGPATVTEIVLADELTRTADIEVVSGVAAGAATAVGANAITDQVLTPQAATTTSEMPAVFDGLDDLVEYAPTREPFRIKLIFLLAFFGAVATAMTFVADVTDIRTTRPTAGITSGVSTIDDLGSNLAVGGLIGAGVMVLGGLLACFGLRWGAGVAGGAGLALLGWAALAIGLAEFPIAVAESITRTSSESFTLTVTRDIGWWLIAGIGMVGLFVFIASLRSFRTGNRVALNPWIAAVGAVSMVVLAAGPLVPIGSATFTDNFRSQTALVDLPTAYFVGRLMQVGLIAIAGVIGFLLVRAYGLGLAAGGVSVTIWLWVTSLSAVRDSAGVVGDNPVGIADRNPGAIDTIPHGVTSVGMGLSIALLIVAALAAMIQQRRVRQRS